MKVPFSWIKEFVDIDVSARELGDKLVSAGFEIEEYIELRDSIKNVVVGKVEDIQRHRDSDHLNICQVNVGRETIQIVTGAQNVKKGDKVPVALDGAVLPDGKQIKSGELRGEKSLGMLCSGEELGLTEDDYPGAGVYGILILNEKEEIGRDINDVIGNDDIVLDVAITANRPDCNSILGVAREVAAVMKKPLKIPNTSYKEVTGDVAEYIKVDNKNYALCPRYMAKAVKDVKLMQSPKVIRDRLKAVGIRPINNLVDVTNYVLTEIGQPMHAFDWENLAGHHIIVRNANEGEKIVALDNKEYVLHGDQLAICDENGPVAIAGVMGGKYASISEKTNTVILESARFARDSIRHTARNLNLHSDSSARYEKGIDFYSQELGLNRALALFDRYGWGTIVKGVVDQKEKETEQKKFVYNSQQICDIIGVRIPTQDIIDILDRLEIYTTADGETLTSSIPSYREDIDGVNDLAEEVIRIYGYDAVRSTLNSTCCGGKNDEQLSMDKIRAIMVGKGAFEAVSYAFVSPKAFDLMNLKEDSVYRKGIAIKNPIGVDMSVMRTTLSYSMIRTIENNVKRGNKNLRFFEISNTYVPHALPITELPDESPKLAIGFYGENENYYSLKSVVDDMLEAMGIAVTYSRADIEYLHPGRSAVIHTNGGEYIGYIGEVHPDVVSNFDVDGRIYLAEIDAAYIAKNAVIVKQYKAISRYQGVERDLALIAPIQVSAASIIQCIYATGGDILESAVVFDVYVGGQIPAGKKSIAVKLSFRDLNKTLKDDDVNKEINKILVALSGKGIILR